MITNSVLLSNSARRFPQVTREKPLFRKSLIRLSKCCLFAAVILNFFISLPSLCSYQCDLFVSLDALNLCRCEIFCANVKTVYKNLICFHVCLLLSVLLRLLLDLQYTVTVYDVNSFFQKKFKMPVFSTFVQRHGVLFVQHVQRHGVFFVLSLTKKEKERAADGRENGKK